MAKVEIRNGVLKTLADGSRSYVGWTKEDKLEGLEVSPTSVLVLDDGTCWALSAPDALPQLEAAELEELRSGECRRGALAKLTELELKELGLKRE